MTPSNISWKDWTALHGLLLLLSFVAYAVFLPGEPRWPFYLLVPVLIYGTHVWLLPPLRSTCSWLAVGELSRTTIGFTVAIILVSCGVLIVYQVLAQPDLHYLREKLPMANLLVAATLFPLGNAILEEIVFRGVCYDSVEAYWGWKLALGVSSLAFGLGHVGGYPPGWVGAVLAGVYGFALGLLRRQSRGLLLPVVAHVFADATIVSLVVRGAS